MDFIVKNVKENVVGMARRIGYVIIDTSNDGEYNLVKKLSMNNYPRFHAYVKHQVSDYVFSFHLDQKQPSYGGGSHAHAGEYFGPVVETEADRIKEIFKN